MFFNIAGMVPDFEAHVVIEFNMAMSPEEIASVSDGDSAWGIDLFLNG